MYPRVVIVISYFSDYTNVAALMLEPPDMMVSGGDWWNLKRHASSFRSSRTYRSVVQALPEVTAYLIPEGWYDDSTGCCYSND